MYGLHAQNVQLKNLKYHISILVPGLPIATYIICIPTALRALAPVCPSCRPKIVKYNVVSKTLLVDKIRNARRHLGLVV